MQIAVPSYDKMIVPTLEAIRQLGGSATISEIYEKVIEIMCLPSEVLEMRHRDTSVSEVEYRLGWSRTYLKKFGMIANSNKGVWSLTVAVESTDNVDPTEVVKTVRRMHRSRHLVDNQEPEVEVAPGDEVAELEWHIQLHKVLLTLPPSAFERLTQRMLRESGFTHVEVTGKSGDGGIDGIGIARVNGFLSFQVLFQCKRHQGSITPSMVRDFRGAMQGRTDKGLFITTGTFTREAMREATRDGAPPVDLIDGEELVNRLKELSLGVRIHMVESVEVDIDWFSKI